MSTPAKGNPSAPAPHPGVLSGDQVRSLGILRIPDSERVRRGADDQHADEFGLTQKDIEVLIRPASVDLRIGRQYIDCQDTNVRVQTRAADTGAVIKLPPLGAIIFSTLESVHTPPNVVGRFDLKIAYAMRGLVLQVGPQIEPSYSGPLFGLLINLSDGEVPLADNSLLTAEFTMLPEANVPKVAKPKSLQDLQDFINRAVDVVKDIRTTRLAAVQRDIEAHTAEAEQGRKEVTTFRSEMNALRAQGLQRAAITVAAVGALLALVIAIANLVLTISRTAPPASAIPATPAPSSTAPSTTTINVFAVPAADPAPQHAPRRVPPPKEDKANNELPSPAGPTNPADPVGPLQPTKPVPSDVQ